MRFIKLIFASLVSTFLLSTMLGVFGLTAALAATPQPSTPPLLKANEIPIPADKPFDKLPGYDASITKSEHIPYPNPRPIHDSLYLDDHNTALYKDIFRLQENGDWKASDKAIEQLTDYRLRGHVLYQRYMHGNKWRASYGELRGWLDLYNDYPNAHRIYNLAVQRHTSGELLPKPNQSRTLIHGMLPALNPNPPTIRVSRAQYKQDAINTLNRRISRDLRRDRPTMALDKLIHDEAAKHMTPREYDTQRAKIAAGYLYYGKLIEARDIAETALKRSGHNVPLAGWIAGLTAWRQGDFNAAYDYFQSPALSDQSSSWTRAAGAYWTSRAAVKVGKFNQVSDWLSIAAEHDRTFYGLLAIQALNQDVQFSWSVPSLTKSHITLLTQYPAARRAILLVDAGQPHLASAELLRLHPGSNHKLKEALLAFSTHNGLPNFAIRFAHAFGNNGKFYDAALYPTGSWEPHNGFQVDKALIHAIARQESVFDYAATNRASKATGLMQILPSTANWVMDTKRFSGAGYHALKDPATNIEVGQKYLARLARQDEVSSDLFSLVIAYNAGPGNLRKWKRKLSDIDDPLLFVEMLPFAETRAYVERVISNYWIYQMRLGKDTPTLRQVVSGQNAYL